MIPTAVSNSSNSIQTVTSASIGIASIILEGRSLSDDDFVVLASGRKKGGNMNHDFCCKIEENKDLELSPSTKTVASYLTSTVPGIKQRTSVFGSSSDSYLHAHQSISSTSMTNILSSESSVEHLESIRRKLCQLRQSLPRTSLELFPSFDKKIIRGESTDAPDKSAAVNCLKLPIKNFLSDIEGHIFPSSSRNYCESLQTESPFTNCILEGENRADNTVNQSEISLENMYTNTSTHMDQKINSMRFGNSPNNRRYMFDHDPDNHLETLQSLASNCLRVSPYSKERDHKDFNFNSTDAYDKTNIALYPKEKKINSLHNISNFEDKSSNVNNSINNINLRNESCNAVHEGQNESCNFPKQGPHCDQFLKKIGIYGIKEQSTDIEEHVCDMNNLDEICLKWQIQRRRMEVILSKSEPICIEVYLGPESNEILMEQWIIQQVAESTTSSMTIQALCNAVRSQLYFSQIAAWTDLIKKINPFDKELLSNKRIKSYSYPFEHCRSTLTELKTSKSPTAIKESTISSKRLPHLDIFYSIKPFESSFAFNSKPIVHNFPNVIISESCAISVCLKSLPRLQGGIPKLIGLSNQQQETTREHQNEQASTVQSLCGAETSEISFFLDNGLSIHYPENINYICDHGETNDGDSDAINSSSSASTEHFSCNTPCSITHRQKQLVKYRKRIMKRDKIKTTDSLSSENLVKKQSKFMEEELNCLERSTKDEEKNIDNNNKIVGKVRVDEIQKFKQQEMGSINSIGLPLYQTIKTESVQTQTTEMITIGTQTTDVLKYHNCQKCFSDVILDCSKCTDTEAKRTLIKDFVDLKHKENQVLAKGELLLQAIQRAPKDQFQNTRKKSNHVRVVNDSSKTLISHEFRKAVLPKINCQLCKRQKTKHIYAQKDKRNKNTNSSTLNNRNSTSNYNKMNLRQTNKYIFNSQQLERKTSCNCSPSCVIVKINDYQTGIKANKSTSNFFISSVRTEQNIDFNTSAKFLMHDKEICVSHIQRPDNHIENLQQTNMEPSNESKLLQNNFDDINSIDKTRKVSIPKKIIKNVFQKSNDLQKKNKAKLISVSMPVTINQQVCSIKSLNSVRGQSALNYENPTEISDISNSARALHNSPSLSQRFIKQSFTHKRRSRHFSDRSQGLSMCSDDISDEDIDGSYVSPSSSPFKSKYFTKLSAFARRPLLGNLEESLFQKRFLPKMNVAGFQVLLGASGQFCPKQITIPAASYIYELEGEILSTPYVCEIRLSRKGYTIPRLGTVQATLLNPFGTVVRMFVIPYDFRDMPPMNQTFIRQRIIAVDSDTLNAPKNNNNTSVNIFNGFKLNNRNHTNLDVSVPHCFKGYLRSLRYSIHLRFQTSRSGRLALHTDIKFLISRRTDCDTAAAHAKGSLESPNELRILTFTPDQPKYSTRQELLSAGKL